MKSHPTKLGVVFGVPPLVFVLALVMGFHAAAPDQGVEAESEPQRCLSPRQRAERHARANKRPMTDVLESRITRFNPALPAKHYDAKGMEEAVAKSYWEGGGCLRNYDNIDYGRGWAKLAPEEMFAWLVTKDGERYMEAHYLFDEWAKLSPERALEASLNLPDRKLQAQALITCLTHLSLTNPARGRDVLQKNLSLYQPGTYKSVFYDYDVGKEFIGMVDSLPPSGERTHLLATLINHMNHDQDTAAYWNGLSADEKSALVDAGLGSTHTTQDSEKVTFEGLEALLRQRVETTGDVDVAEALFIYHGKEWATQDLMGAQAWVNQYMKGMSRIDALQRLWSAAAYGDLETTVAHWRQLPDGNFKDDMALQISSGAWNRKEEAKQLLGIE